MMFDPEKVRNDFPIFSHPTPAGKQLVYLDNAATTQKPLPVIESLSEFYSQYNSNIHRGAYWPASQASGKYEEARNKVAEFINADPQCVVFTSGTTDGINRVASSFLEPELKTGDDVVVTMMEHHSNFIPWQQACKREDAVFKVCPLNEDLSLNLDEMENLITDHTELVAISSISNTLGVKNNLKRVIEKAHHHGAWVLVDAAQSIAHMPMDVQELDCDFLVFSGHKLYGPTGIGILYGKREALELMKPYPMGGGGIKDVSVEETVFANLPAKFEAGTPHISGAIGLATAIDYLTRYDFKDITDHTTALALYLRERLSEMDEVTCYGEYGSEIMGPVVSFNVEGIHPHDIQGFFSEAGIGIRAGHHCTQPLMDHLEIPGTCRISFGIYNSNAEVDLVVETLEKTIQFFS